MSADDFEQRVVMMGNNDGTLRPVAVDADGALLFAGIDSSEVTPDTIEAATWDTSLTSIISNLNRIRNQITAVSGEAWGSVSHSLAALWLKFNASTGHAHSGAADDGKQVDHGTLGGLSDDDHSQYLNNTRHDTTARHGSSVVDHGSIGGLADDDHTQYFLADASRKLTGSQILRAVDNAGVYFCGGSSVSGKGAYCLIFGADHATQPGALWLVVPNAAKTGSNVVISITGSTNTPEINFNSFRAYGVKTPSNASDIVDKNYVDAVGQAWADYTPTLVWTTATPASVSVVARWTQIGRVLYVFVYVNSTDSNGATNLTITLPKTVSDPGVGPAAYGYQIYGAAGSSYADPLPYIASSVSKIQFRNFQAGTDGQRIAVVVSAFCEVP